MSQIKCKNCHQNIDTSDKFCPHCGELVQNSVKEEGVTCPKCGHLNPSRTSFCENCGSLISAKKSVTSDSKPELKTFKSEGSYSGSMVKSKSSKSYKTFKIILLVLLVIGGIAFVMWFNNDPDAKEKLINVLFSAGFILVFVLIIWRKSKKGKMISSRKRKATYDWEENDRRYAEQHEDDNDDYDDDYDDD